MMYYGKVIEVVGHMLNLIEFQTVKVDMNIERDLAFALQVKECPQLLFLRGNKILYREKGE